MEDGIEHPDWARVEALRLAIQVYQHLRPETDSDARDIVVIARHFHRFLTGKRGRWHGAPSDEGGGV